MDAVAVCAVCGMGLCMDHVVERETVAGWASEARMVVLCQRCARRPQTETK